MLVAGPLSDRLGRRRVAVSGLLAAAAASAVVAMAPTFPVLLATRVLQGGAAAFFPSVALAYLTGRIDAGRRPAAACALVPLLTPALARVSGRRRLVAALAVMTVAVAGAGLTTGPTALAIALAAMTAGVAATAPALVETIVAASPARQRGSATALYGFTLFVGASLAAPAAVTTRGLGFTFAAARYS